MIAGSLSRILVTPSFSRLVMLIRKTFGASGGEAIRISSSKRMLDEVDTHHKHHANSRLVRMATECAPGRYRFPMPCFNVRERRTTSRLDSRFITRKSNAPIKPRMKMAATRLPANTVA